MQEIKKKEFKKTKIVLSFDDGRRDNYRVAIEILAPRKLKATFNITTGYVEGSIHKRNFPCENESLTIEEVKELYQNEEFEIAGHGHEHINTVEDWKKGIETLKSWLGDEWSANEIGIASPHSGISVKEIVLREKILQSLDVKYVRIGLSNQRRLLQRIVSRVARQCKSNKLFYCPIRNSLIRLGEQTYVYSIPVLNQHTVEQLKYTINKAILKNKDCVLMFHSILKSGEPYANSMWSWDYDKFIDLCDYLVQSRDEGNIEVVTTREVF